MFLTIDVNWFQLIDYGNEECSDGWAIKDFFGTLMYRPERIIDMRPYEEYLMTNTDTTDGRLPMEFFIA